MSETFIPLFAKTVNGAEPSVEFSRLKVKASPAPSAVPALAGTSSSATVATQAAAPAVACNSHGTPVVSLQKDGDKITGIRIECSCGQVINLECGY